jgi:hypothetical protein
LAINTGSAGAPVLFNGGLGTPTSGTVTNLTGTASININGTVGATTPAQGNFTFLFQGTAGAQGLGVGFSGAAGQGFSLRDTTNSRTYFFTTETSTGLQINAGANPISLIASSLAVTGALSSTTGANFATSSGSVGIGTTSPVSLLNPFKSTAGSSFTIANSFLQLSGGGSTGAVFPITFGYSGASAVNAPAYLGMVITDSTSFTNGALVFGTRSVTTDTLPTERARITSAGNFGIGTSTPNFTGIGVDHTVVSVGSSTSIGMIEMNANRTADGDLGRLVFGNNSTRLAEIYASRIDANTSTKLSFSTADAGSMGVRMTISKTGAIRFNTYGAGALTTDASGNITASSDERIKSNIRPFSRGLTEILAINPILHGYTEESGLDQSRDDYAGFSAQQVQQIIPEAVGANADGMLSFSDRPVMAALVNAMKELNANLVAQVAALSQRLAALETK